MLFYSHDPGFSLADWRRNPITQIFAGCDCVMALTEDGRVLQKVADPATAARTEFWRNIQSIAISSCVPGAAIGLINDGTCMISKKPIRTLYGEAGLQRINAAVKSWKDIVAVYASDAFFALDKDGRVHSVCFDSRSDDYQDTENWQNIERLITGNQNSLFGITRDGQVLCAGHNCVAGPYGDLRERLAGVSDVATVCPAGSECERLMIFRKDGSVSDLNGTEYAAAALPVCVSGCYTLSAYMDTNGHLKLVPYCGNETGLQYKNAAIHQFSVGQFNHDAFWVAVGKPDNLLTRIFGTKS